MSKSISSKKYSEKEWQKATQRFLSDPSSVFLTKTGRRLQVLSPGQINPFEGPDFKDIAIMLDGYVVLGDAEFHVNSSDWMTHNHDNDKKYKRVILHIILNDNFEINQNFETLIINSDDLENYLIEPDKPETDLESIEDLQHYSLIRLLRKSSEAQIILNQNDLATTFTILVKNFIDHYNSKRRRPVYNSDSLNELIDNLCSSPLFQFLQDIYNDSQTNVADRILTLVKTKISNEGLHLRREIILNCTLPLSLCLASEQTRINLFLWYWSTPSLNHYGILNRKYPNLPQNFLWQQQGMLEYIKEHGSKINVVSEAMQNYGFAEILSFYRLGNAPFNQTDENEFD